MTIQEAIQWGKELAHAKKHGLKSLEARYHGENFWLVPWEGMPWENVAELRIKARLAEVWVTEWLEDGCANLTLFMNPGEPEAQQRAAARKGRYYLMREVEGTGQDFREAKP